MHVFALVKSLKHRTLLIVYTDELLILEDWFLVSRAQWPSPPARRRKFNRNSHSVTAPADGSSASNWIKEGTTDYFSLFDRSTVAGKSYLFQFHGFTGSLGANQIQGFEIRTQSVTRAQPKQQALLTSVVFRFFSFWVPQNVSISCSTTSDHMRSTSQILPQRCTQQRVYADANWDDTVDVTHRVCHH